MCSPELVRSSENRAALWAAFLCSFCSLLRAQEDNLVETFDIESYDTERLREAADAGRPFLLSYFGDTHTLRVEPSQLRSERFTMTSVTRDGFRPMIPSRTRVYKGSVVGDPESIVRLMIDHRGLRGFIKSSEGWTFIEPVDKSGKVARAHGDSNVEHRVFGEQDLSDGNIGTCGGAHAQAGAQIEESSLVEDRMHIEEGTASPDAVTLAPPPRSEELQEDDPAPAEPGSLGMLGVAVVADFEFFQIHGANALAEIEATINSVDGIYESELGLGVEIIDVTIWEDAADPYEQTDALNLLVELRSYWNVNKSGMARDVVHLFTGKNLDSSTVGIAYVGVVCNLGSAYSLSQDLQSDYLEGVLVAHELGHALGSQHDPVSTTPRYIMYPSLSGATLDEFSTGTATTITSYSNAVGCLGAGGGAGQSGNSTSGGGRRSGGGGGPVDPVVLLVVGLGIAAESLRRRGTRQA